MMKYSSINLNDPDLKLPLPSKVKLCVEYRPNGVYREHVPMFYSADPEGEVDRIVQERGWAQEPNFKPADVWVDAGF